MHIAIPDNFLRVTPETLTEVTDQVFYTKGRYTNATEYRFRLSGVTRVAGTIFGYEDTKGQCYLTRLWPFGNGAYVDQARAGRCCAEIR